MRTLSDFQISKDLPPVNPEHLQLYSLPTPNGRKISIALDELGVPYDFHTISIMDGDQFTPGFLEIAPNNKIPAIIDPNGPDGAMPLFESGAILIYLAEKHGALLSTDPVKRAETLQWLMWQMGGLGPMMGQLGFFYRYGGKDFEDKRPQQRYAEESKRLLGVLDKQLEGQDWVVGEFSIADIAIAPWLHGIVATDDGASDLVGWGELRNVPAYLERFNARPAVAKDL